MRVAGSCRKLHHSGVNDFENPFPSEDEIQFIARLSKQMLAPEGLEHLLALIDPADSFRVQPLALCLKQAREANGWTIKFCAEALRTKQTDLKSLESGRLERSETETLGRYVAFLGLQKVYSQWVEANRSFAERLA